MQKRQMLAMVLLAVCAGWGMADSCVEPLGRWPYGPAWAAAVQGHRAYYGSGAVLVIADIEDPANPILKGRVAMPDLIRDIAVSGSYAYVADDGAGIRIVDVSNPMEPVEVGSHETWEKAQSVVVSGTYAYVVSTPGGLDIFDVSDPIAPVHSGYYSASDYTFDVSLVGTHLYLGEDAGLRVLDVANPGTPVPVGHLLLPQRYS